MIRVVVFDSGGATRCGGEELLGVATPEGGALWIDLEGPDKRFEPMLLQWGFHPLAIEDTFTLQHQPKVEEYDEELFVIVRALDFNAAADPATGELSTLKLAAFLGEQRLVTLHRAPLRSLQLVYDRLQSTHRAFPGGPVQVLWSIYDELMDLYFPVVDAVGVEIERLEEQVVSCPEREHLERLLDLRRKLSTLRRTMLPHRQVFGHLSNSRFGPIDDTAALNFRDTQDNVLRLVDAIEQQRDLLTNVKDTYLSVIAQKTNDIMRVLTVFSAIILPLTFIVGVYGMNFEHMPELAWPWAYPALLGAMALIAVGMLAWFRRKGWL